MNKLFLKFYPQTDYGLYFNQVEVHFLSGARETKNTELILLAVSWGKEKNDSQTDVSTVIKFNLIVYSVVLTEKSRKKLH